MFRGTFVATCALAVALTGIVASPTGAEARTTVNWGTSFVDVDNNGVKGPNDLSLATEIAKTGVYYTHTSGALYGVVFENVSLSGSPLYQVQVNGNISVRGKYNVRGDGSMSFTTSQGDVNIAAGATLTSKSRLSFEAPNGAVNIGARAQISGGVDYTTSLFAGKTATIGDGVKFTVSSGYHTIQVRAYGPQLAVGKNISATGPGHGKFMLVSDGDLEIRNMNVKIGYIEINTGHTGIATKLRIYDSTFSQNYKNGTLQFTTSNNGPFAADAMVLDNVTITSAGNVVMVPMPIVR